jgi:hypothetical protein
MTPAPPPNPFARGTVTYEDVRIGIVPEGPRHYEVLVGRSDGDHAEHAVEYVAVNATRVDIESPLWFDGATLQVGVPDSETGETAWVWA